MPRTLLMGNRLLTFRYKIPDLKEWVEIRLSRLLTKENVGQVCSLAWKYNSEILLHASFKKLKSCSEEVKTKKEWKEIFEGKEEFVAEMIKKF